MDRYLLRCTDHKVSTTPHSHTQIKYMEATPKLTLGLQTQHTYTLEDNTWFLHKNHMLTNTNSSIDRYIHKQQSHNITLTSETKLWRRSVFLTSQTYYTSTRLQKPTPQHIMDWCVLCVWMMELSVVFGWELVVCVVIGLVYCLVTVYVCVCALSKCIRGWGGGGYLVNWIWLCRLAYHIFNHGVQKALPR